jgi:hypothetical protein
VSVHQDTLFAEIVIRRPEKPPPSLDSQDTSPAP